MLGHKVPNRYQRLLDLLALPDPSAYDAYRTVRSLFPLGSVRRILHHYGFDGASVTSAYGQETNRLWRNANDAELAQASLAEQVSALEMGHYMRNQLLRDSDVMSMRWGLELRVPFLDQTFMQGIAQIPPQLRFAGHKDVLTKAIPELPPPIIQQPKQGFVFPLADWLNHQWQEKIPVPTIAQVPLQSWYMKWSLFILQNWLDSVGISI